MSRFWMGVWVFLSISGAGQIKAQNLENILKQKVGKVVGQLTKVEAKDLVGTWVFQGSACQFESEELLQKAGGVVLAESVEKKLDDVYGKAGISGGNLSYTFNADSTFTCLTGKRKMKGTYSYNASDGKLVLKYYSLLTSEARVAKNGSGISLLFDADRLLKLVVLLSNFSDNTVLQGVGKVAGQYDGMLLGFELARQ